MYGPLSAMRLLPQAVSVAKDTLHPLDRSRGGCRAEDV